MKNMCENVGQIWKRIVKMRIIVPVFLETEIRVVFQCVP